MTSDSMVFHRFPNYLSPKTRFHKQHKPKDHWLIMQTNNLTWTKLDCRGQFCYWRHVWSGLNGSDCPMVLAGMQWESPTNQLRSTSGWARTRPPGSCAVVITPGWCGTAGRRRRWSPRHTCGALACCSTTTEAPWPSTMPSARSTSIPSTSPLLSPSALSLASGTSAWPCWVGCPSPTTWRTWIWTIRGHPGAGEFHERSGRLNSSGQICVPVLYEF